MLLLPSRSSTLVQAMLQLLSAIRRRWRRVQWRSRKRSARVFDEAAAPSICADDDDATEAAPRRRPPRVLAALRATARAPLAVASFIARSQASEDMEARGGRLRAAEIGDLMFSEAMRYAMYM
ncbi:hypothetical protein Cni_G00695 [Canna indica]|uniref:Uncharacterized protein n=1 Tax=Canna indica TaxID=4628 RepID=A0AAQ3PZZ3_9LILI|nr:hypothetical protein Cni_G00695 [Canna indica]